MSEAKRTIGPRQRKKIRRRKRVRLILFIIMAVAVVIAGFRYGLKKNKTADKTGSTITQNDKENENSKGSDDANNNHNTSSNGKSATTATSAELSEIKHSNEKEDLIKNLKIFSKINPKASLIADKADQLNHKMLALAGNDKDSIDFVYGFITGDSADKEPEVKEGESYKLGRKYPLYLQWDKRWGYESYGDGSGNMGIYGCGPCTMAMLISGLKKDKSVLPMEMAKIATEGNFIYDNGTDWAYMDSVPKKYGIKVENIQTVEAFMKQALKDGSPLIVNVGPGDFTFGGHYLLIVGIDDKGNFIINDSNSIEKSKKAWSFQELKPQIKAIWKYSL